MGMPSPARADEPVRAAADSPDSAERVAELKRAGDELLLDGHPIDALAYYDRALALRRDPAVVYNRGRAYNALARYPEALADFEAFAREATPELLARVPALQEFLATVRRRVGRVHIECSEAGARVTMNGKDLGVTPLADDIAVNAGSLVIELTKEGFFPHTHKSELAGGSRSIVAAVLASRANRGVLTVTSNTAGAHVKIDGTPVGMVPAEQSLFPGEHRIEVSHEGYLTSTNTVLTRAGETKTLAVELERERSVLSRWWFWTTVGAVVAGGAITAVALTRERPLDQGTIEPGSLRAGWRF
jgi:hypothetical protein